MTRWGWLLLGCLLPQLAVAGEKLGRLFFTTAERADLDDLRQPGKPPEKSMKPGKDDAGTTGAVKPGVPAMVRVGGYVTRSDGRTTVWINGRALAERTATAGMEFGRLRGDTRQIQIKLPGNGQTVNLRAGQSYDPASGKVIDPLTDSLPGTVRAEAEYPAVAARIPASGH